MKILNQIKFMAIIAMVLVISTASTCSSDDSPSSSSNSTTDVINIVNNGTWRITYYYDTDHEETNNFSGYNFAFGSITAIWCLFGSSILIYCINISNSERS